MAKQKSARTGKTPTEAVARLHDLIVRVWRHHVSVKSDYARENAQIVGMAASLQMITTKVGRSTYANAWHVTRQGLTWLHDQDNK